MNERAFSIAVCVAVVVALTMTCGSGPVSTKARAPVAVVESSVVVVPDGLGSFTKAAFESHIAQLKKRLPSRDFTIVVQPPFVVVGDEPEEIVKWRADGTIKWAVEKLKQDFFTDDPKEIFDIWLFKNAASYDKHTRLLFNDTGHQNDPSGFLTLKAVLGESDMDQFKPKFERFVLGLTRSSG